MAPAAVLATLPAPLAARAARRLLRSAHPPYPGTGRDVAAIVEVANGERSRATLTGGLQVVREGPLVAVGEVVGPQIPDPVELDEGATVDFGPWRLSRRPVTGIVPVRLGRFSVITGLAGRLLVRSSAEGERIDIGGGSKLVRDAMAEAGIAPRLRSAWPVVSAAAKIVWVPGARLAPAARLEWGAQGPATELSMEGTGS